MEKNKKKHGSLLLILCSMLIGFACGISIAKFIAKYASHYSPGKLLIFLGFALLGMYFAVFLQTILHEAGHLLAGLACGYRFSSFRIGSLIFTNEQGHLKTGRLSLAGTGGQCLMSPPDLKDGKLPFVLYNLGGVLMNLLTLPLCFLLAHFSTLSFLKLFFQMLGIAGLGSALINGIPLKLGMVNNDGSNILELKKSPEALQSFWTQLKVAEQNSKGVRLKDMPEKWFSLPEESQLHNSMTAVLAVFCANRLMDEHAFSEAEALTDRLLAADSGIIDLHRNLLTCDRLYCALLHEPNSAVIESLYTKKLQKFMKQMRNHPAILRTQYTYALLHEKNTAKAMQIRESFEKSAKSYPYASDIESERELLKIADTQVQKNSRQVPN